MLSESTSAAPAAPGPDLSAERAFKDLATILYSVAASPSHYRNFAVRYMQCRDILLHGEARPLLPGFLVQCGTSEKFREFITLYAPDADARRLFLDRALAPCQSLLGSKRGYDAFGDAFDDDF